MLCGIGFFLANLYIFKVKNWTVVLSEDNLYSQENIIKASGIEEGAELFGFDKRLAENNIKKELAYVESVSILRIPPFTVRIAVKTDEAAFGFTLGGDYYIISEKFRVAEKISINNREQRDFVPPGVVNIVTDDVKKCFVGETIEFADEDILDFLKELLRLIKENEDAEMISSVNIKDKFDVVMNYSDLYLVKFGVFENIYSKALGSFAVINEVSERGLTGIIDISEEKIAPFTPDGNITNNKLYFDKK